MKELATIAAALWVVLNAHSSASQSEPPDDFEAILDLYEHPLDSRGSIWRCTPTVRYVCTAAGCEQHPPVVTLRIDFAEKTYTRCEGEDCDTHSATWRQSGIFTAISPEGSGSTFAKILNDGSQYVEAVSLHLVVHQNFGTCGPAP